MLPYIFLATSPFLLGFLLLGKFQKPETEKKLFVILFGFILFFMIAFRSRFLGSTDSFIYYQNWIDYSRMDLDAVREYIEESRMESGFIYTVWFLGQFIKNAQFIFIFSGALFSVAVCRFIYKNSEDIMLSCVMFVTLGLYVFMVQGLRQGIAMSILLFSVEFVKKRKLIPFLLVVLLASQFHQTAIVFVIVYFLYNLELKPITLLVFSSIGALMIAFSNVLISLGNEYFERDYYGDVDEGGFIATAIYVIILVATLLFARKNKENKSFAMFVYMTIMGLVFYIMRYFDAMIVERISFYFMFGQLALLPSIINCLDAKERQVVKLAVYILCILLFIYRTNGSNLEPFKFFWQ